MSLKLKLRSEPWETDEKIFKNLNREIEDGLHVLVGPNGYGKSTFMYFIKEKYERDENYKLLTWDGVINTRDGKSGALLRENFELLANMMMSSEGEEHNINLAIFLQRVGREVANLDRDLILLLDAIDSGISADRIEETIDVLAMIITDVRERGHECYIFVPSNTYEMARRRHCMDPCTGEDLVFNDYEDWRNYIFKCAKKIEKRRK